jgi:hypothetical protein
MAKKPRRDDPAAQYARRVEKGHQPFGLSLSQQYGVFIPMAPGRVAPECDYNTPTAHAVVCAINQELILSHQLHSGKSSGSAAFSLYQFRLDADDKHALEVIYRWLGYAVSWKTNRLVPDKACSWTMILGWSN